MTVTASSDVKTVRITQLDGKLPNLALMRLSAWHRAGGDDVRWERGIARHLGEPDYDIVYGSAIFGTSAKATALFRQQWPQALVGGSGGDADLRVEDIVPTQFTHLDYSGYPDFDGSIGYAMRGCRFKCGFCVVPKQEGAARHNQTVGQIWRGPGYPKHLHLLDNDFFGNPEWRAAVDAIVDGGFKVCINQGINIRLLSGKPWNLPKTMHTIGAQAEAIALADEQVDALIRMAPRDDSFKNKRIYTAWDNLGDEDVFVLGVERLVRRGWNADNIMSYMLVGYDKRETWERIFHRYERMMRLGIRPYPMVHDRFRHEKPDHWRKLKMFQGWIIRGTHKKCSFDEFNASHKPSEPEGDLLKRMAA